MYRRCVFSSITGKDTNSGSEVAPVATLTKALSLVGDGGTVYITDTYTPAYAEEKLSANSNKTVTITGGTFDASDRQHDVHLACGIIFDDVTVIFKDGGALYANGYPLTIKENVTVKNTLATVYGGSYRTTVASTDVTLLSGNYTTVFGGGYGADVTGTAKLYIGGDVNASFDVKGTNHDVGIYGGSRSFGNVGATDITVAGNAKMYSLYGGGWGSNDGETPFVNADKTKITMTGGYVAQVFGGSLGDSMTGDTEVNLLGGKVLRRIYGGCYNEDKDETYHVTGKTTVKIASGFTFECSGTSSDVKANEGIRAGSRLAVNSQDEVSTLIFDSADTQTKCKLAADGDAVLVSLAFGGNIDNTTDTTLVDATQF